MDKTRLLIENRKNSVINDWGPFTKIVIVLELTVKYRLLKWPKNMMMSSFISSWMQIPKKHQVVCDGGAVLSVGGSFNASQAYEEIEVSTVVEPFACCTLTITDGGSDGLNSPEPGFENGYSIYLDWASHKVLGYSMQTGFEFSSLSIEFGLGC